MYAYLDSTTNHVANRGVEDQRDNETVQPLRVSFASCRDVAVIAAVSYGCRTHNDFSKLSAVPRFRWVPIVA